jgi:hypothetical protein
MLLETLVTDRTRSTSPTSPGPVRVVIDHAAAVVHADFELLRSILPALEYRCVEYIPGGKQGYGPKPVIIELHRVDLRGRLAVRPGLLPVLVEALRVQGWQPVVEDQRIFPPELAADAGVLAGAADDELRLMQAVLQEVRGQIQVRDLAGRVWAIVRLMELFPKARVLVMSASKKRGRQVWRALREQLGDQVQLVSGQWQAERRCVISTYSYTEPGDWDIIRMPLD